MFKRLNSEYEKGSGLGLNITQNLVKRLNGEIAIAHSELNKGTTIQLNFPVKVASQEELVEAKQTAV